MKKTCETCRNYQPHTSHEGYDLIKCLLILAGKNSTQKKSMGEKMNEKKTCGNCKNYYPHISYNGECNFCLIALPYWFNGNQIQTEIVEEKHDASDCKAWTEAK